MTQFPNAVVDDTQFCGCEFPSRAARAAASESQQIGDLRQREAHCLSTLDESQPLRIGVRVAPDAAGGCGGSGISPRRW
jgi:hypothetical protein